MKTWMLCVLAMSALWPIGSFAQTVEAEVDGQTQVVFVEHEDATVVVEEEAAAQPSSSPAPAAEARAELSVQAPSVEINVPTPPTVQLVREDRQLLRARLAEYPLGGPIAMMVIGYPLAGLFGLAASYTYQAGDYTCSAFECSDGGSGYTIAAVVLGAVGLAALVIGIVGTVKLIRRVSQRSAIRTSYRQGRLSFTGDSLQVRF